MKPQSCLYYLVDGGIDSPSIADDYFAVMQRVEQRLEIIPELKQETKDQVTNVLPTVQLLAWVERLTRPQLCQEERLEIAESLKQVLCLNIANAPSPPLAQLLFSNLNNQYGPMAVLMGRMGQGRSATRAPASSVAHRPGIFARG